MPPARGERLVDRTKNNRCSVTRDPTRKDLIFIKNRQNGKVYKFACLTCISGHRAPQCDPAKHKDKVLFRRPEPGRPAKNCGHPVSQGCDCKALRNLCCLLAPEQWVELIAGGIPTATMYESEEALNKAQNDERLARETQERVQQAQAYEQAMLAASQYAYQAMPYRPAQHEMPFVQTPGQMALPYLYDQALPEQFGFFDDQQIPMTFDPAAYQVPIEAPFDPAFYSQYQDMTIPADAMALQRYAANMGLEEQMAAQPSANPSQSCCSMSRPAQPAQNIVQPAAFGLPGAPPRSQFPCQSCASYTCGCITCPEVRQGPSGAWSQSCGRGGHLDNPVLKQEFSSSQGGVFPGLAELEAPVDGFYPLPPLDAPQLREFAQFGQSPTTFEEILGYEGVSDPSRL